MLLNFDPRNANLRRLKHNSSSLLNCPRNLTVKHKEMRRGEEAAWETLRQMGHVMGRVAQTLTDNDLKWFSKLQSIFIAFNNRSAKLKQGYDSDLHPHQQEHRV
jgi:hypothetical protein